MGAYIQGTVRYDNKSQLRRLKLAAERVHWSLNRLLLVGAEKLADEFLKTTETTAGVVEAAHLMMDQGD